MLLTPNFSLESKKGKILVSIIDEAKNQEVARGTVSLWESGSTLAQRTIQNLHKAKVPKGFTLGPSRNCSRFSQTREKRVDGDFVPKEIVEKTLLEIRKEFETHELKKYREAKHPIVYT